MRLSVFILLSLPALALSACALSPSPCAAAGSASCQLDPAWERRVVEPLAAAVVSSREDVEALPRTVTFGSAAWGKVALYLRFPELAVPAERIERAFLRLEPSPSSASDTEPVDVQVWRVRRAWAAGRFDWSSQPSLGPPRAHASALARATLLIDVTELVRDAEGHRTRSHGLAVLAGAGSGHGATFATGSGGAQLPRLEVYLRAQPTR